MDLNEFMDLYELEPVIARIRLDEITFTFDSTVNKNKRYWLGTKFKGEFTADWERWEKFCDSLPPKWIGWLSLHGKAFMLVINFAKLTDGDWDEILSINPDMIWYRKRENLKVALTSPTVSTIDLSATEQAELVPSWQASIKSIWTGIYQRLLVWLP